MCMGQPCAEPACCGQLRPSCQGAGGDDWDNAIIKWIGDTQLTPAVRAPPAWQTSSCVSACSGPVRAQQIMGNLRWCNVVPVRDGELCGLQGIKWRTPRMVARLKAVAEAAKVQPGHCSGDNGPQQEDAVPALSLAQPDISVVLQSGGEQLGWHSASGAAGTHASLAPV